MPELPDIEVFTRSLNKLLAKQRIAKVKIVNGKKLPDKPAALTKALKGKVIDKIYRSGKEMRYLFTDGTLLGMHLMLTGDIILFDEKNDHHSTIIELYFDSGKGLALTDRMRNAHVKLDPVDKEGLDALSPKLNLRYFKDILQRKRNIKSLLTDQGLIRGIGNSYSDEMLWEAKISPYSTANAIPEDKAKDLHKAMKHVLKKEITNIAKKYPGKVNGEVKEFLKIHQKVNPKSPTGGTIIIDKKGMMKTYYTKEQKLYS
jgi:formamidopyrimidine-DNA glycosylase